MKPPLQSTLFLAIIFSSAAFAQSPEDQQHLDARFKGKVIHAKLTFADTAIHFDRNGKPKHGSTACASWTLCNTFKVDKIQMTGHSIKVSADRLAVGYPDGKQHLYSLNLPTSIEIDFDGTPSEATAETALGKVFVRSNEKLADYLPYAWARYLDPKTGVSSPQPGDKPVPIKLRVSSGVQASKLLKQPKPSYPATARALHQSGTVRLQATIGKDGLVHELYLVQPAGFGMDEAAIDAVKDWTYQPTLFNGEPVDVETIISVHFQLAK